MVAEKEQRKRVVVDLNEALVGFRELGVQRGPTFLEFATFFNMAGSSSAQGVYRRLAALGYIEFRAGPTAAPSTGYYVMTPFGEQRYRMLIPNEHERQGPAWPTE